MNSPMCRNGTPMLIAVDNEDRGLSPPRARRNNKTPPQSNDVPRPTPVAIADSRRIVVAGSGRTVTKTSTMCARRRPHIHHPADSLALTPAENCTQLPRAPAKPPTTISIGAAAAVTAMDTPTRAGRAIRCRRIQLIPARVRSVSAQAVVNSSVDRRSEVNRREEPTVPPNIECEISV